MNPIFKKGDIFVVAILAALGVSSLILILFIQNKSSAKNIKIVSSEGTMVFALIDTTVEVEGPLGITRITVEKKHVWISQASCPRKICMRQGKISKPGESLVCLPNQIVVSIEGSAKTDAVSY